jgi:predicted Zn-dependent protease
MKRILSLIVVLSVFIACSKNSVTGRKQLKLFAEETLQQQAITEYRSFLSQNKVLSGTVNKDAEMVNRVGTRIARAITDYYTQKGLANELNGYKWEFNLVESKEVNAWCMPGGKVVVYTGLLNISQNEAALAVVMGHEITHAIAHHGNERISQVALAQGLEIAGNIFTSGNQKANNIFNNVFGPTAQTLPPCPDTIQEKLSHFGSVWQPHRVAVNHPNFCQHTHLMRAVLLNCRVIWTRH